MGLPSCFLERGRGKRRAALGGKGERKNNEGGEGVATTAQEIFELTMAKMDELDDNGNVDSSDTAEYKNRTLGILNILQGEVFPYSDTYQDYADQGRRPICPAIESFDEPLQLDDFICKSVLPYGLAAHLLLDENPSAAGFYQQRYEELLRKLQSGFGLAATSEDIVDVYGMGRNPFTRW